MKSRVVLLFVIFLSAWGVLITRAAMLQIFPDGRLENLKRRQFETTLQIRTRRGAILDRNGTELATSVPSYSLFADPKLIKNPKGLARRLARFFNLDKSALRKRLDDSRRRFVWVKRHLTENQKSNFEQLNEQLNEPGLRFIEEPKRIYPNGGMLAQVLGFVGSDDVGLEGLELQFEKNLQGRMKELVLPRDAFGRPLLLDGNSLTEVPDGADLVLTIDHEVQFNLERELSQVVLAEEATGAVGIVLDAQTSEVLAMSTVPTVDLNDDGGHFAKAMGSMRNSAVADAFEPGSVMKTFSIAGAVRQDVVKPGTLYFCENGRMKVGDKWIKEAERKEAYQWLNVTEILAYSSNVGAAKIAFDLGAERLRETLADFGFGAKTGVELPGESHGILNRLPWRPHLLANISFGQGVAATPLQIAAAYTAIANGGMLKRPLLVKEIRPHDEDQSPQEFQAENVRRVLTKSQAATLRLMLMAATEAKATGFRARIPGYFVAGKTGTAQKVNPAGGGYLPNAYISSFAGFVPANNPKFVIYIVVDSPRKAYYGTQVAAPVFARMAQYLVRHAALPPEQISEENVILSESDKNNEKSKVSMPAAPALVSGGAAPANLTSSQFPNLLGLSLRQALMRLRDLSNEVRIRGHGLVVRSLPSAGATVAAKSPVTLILENPD